MAIPTSYNDFTLSQFMLNELAEVNEYFNWTPASFGEQVIDTLIDYGVSTLADATDIPKLRAIARLQVWSKAKRAAAKFIDNRLVDDDRSQSQLFDHIDANYQQAQAAASIYLTSADSSSAVASGNVATVGKIVYLTDPYQMAVVDG